MKQKVAVWALENSLLVAGPQGGGGFCCGLRISSARDLYEAMSGKYEVLIQISLERALFQRQEDVSGSPRYLSLLTQSKEFRMVGIGGFSYSFLITEAIHAFVDYFKNT